MTALVLEPASPSILYAATARGIFKTVDGGQRWRPKGAGLGDKSVLSLAIDPRDPPSSSRRPTPAASSSSTDAGETWSAANAGIGARYVGAVAVDPHARSTVYAGTEAGRLFKSIDGGETWTEAKSPTSHVCVTAIAPDPVTPGILYVGTNSEGVYKTIDGGATWTHPTKGMKRGDRLEHHRATRTAPRRSTPEPTTASTRASTPARYWTPHNRGLTSFNVLALRAGPDVPVDVLRRHGGRDLQDLRTPATPGTRSTPTSTSPRSRSTRDASSTLYAATHLGVMKSMDRRFELAALRLALSPHEEAEAAQALPPCRSWAPRS